jgi:hypothetical protein
MPMSPHGVAGVARCVCTGLRAEASRSRTRTASRRQREFFPAPLKKSRCRTTDRRAFLAGTAQIPPAGYGIPIAHATVSGFLAEGGLLWRR